MENDKRRKKPMRSRRNAPQIGVVRVFSDPGPDAEDRLRRVFAILVRHATRDGLDAPDEGQHDTSPAESRPEEED